MTSELASSSALVLASSSRSGSTWLADMLSFALQRQQIFEPLHPEYDATVRQLTGFDPHRDRISSFYLRSGSTQPAWHQFLSAVLTGHVRNAWTDAAPAIESPRGLLIKMIRANLMLGYLYDHFQPKIVYLVRHPCAVVNSRLWQRWSVDARLLLKQEELVEDYLRPWVTEIERETDPVGSHALWWGVENLVAQRELAGRPHYRVYFESLMLDPRQGIKRIADYIGSAAGDVPQAMIEKPSWTSSRKGGDALIAPLVSWKAGLAQEQQDRTLVWAYRLGITWYNTEIWPVDNLPVDAEGDRCAS